MHKVILIDDEPLARQLLKSLFKAHDQFEVVAECGDGFEGFKSIQEQNPALIFLDVQMPKLNGFEMLELLDEAPAVVFTTAFDEYAMKAFDAHAIDYLLKPVTKERFDKAIDKFLLQADKELNNIKELASENIYGGYQQRLVVKDNGLIRIIPASEIHYIEASDDYIKIHTADRHFLKKATLSATEKALDPKQFIRVHRSYIAPVNQLVRIEPYEKDSHLAILQCGAKIAVSKSGMEKLKTNLGW
ncbi:MAG: response regulator transcription factor [Chitinophagales bacterium]|nr:response regulator transcription factor [Chitinophagaceae bacterium]MCB9064301.1 response regulator transcription factor [Chitinophagales bacterium]